MTNATEIVLLILKQKSQRVLFSGMVVTFVLEFVNVMKGSQGIYKKEEKEWFCIGKKLVSYKIEFLQKLSLSKIDNGFFYQKITRNSNQKPKF